MIEFLRSAITFVLGVAMVAAMLVFVYKRFAIDWAPLAKVYGRRWQKPLMKKRFANLVLYSEGRPARAYKGVVSIGLYIDGIALRPNQFLAPFHPPIFVPYGDINGWNQVWYIDGKSTELTFDKVPTSRLIMPRDQVEWMLSLDPGAASISSDKPPHGTRPWASSLIALGMGAMGLSLIAALVLRGFLGDL